MRAGCQLNVFYTVYLYTTVLITVLFKYQVS